MAPRLLPQHDRVASAAMRVQSQARGRAARLHARSKRLISSADILEHILWHAQAQAGSREERRRWTAKHLKHIESESGQPITGESIHEDNPHVRCLMRLKVVAKPFRAAARSILCSPRFRSKMFPLATLWSGTGGYPS